MALPGHWANDFLMQNVCYKNSNQLFVLSRLQTILSAPYIIHLVAAIHLSTVTVSVVALSSQHTDSIVDRGVHQEPSKVNIEYNG